MATNISSRKTNFVPQQKEVDSGIDPTVIIKKQSLKCIESIDYKDSELSLSQNFEEWYPYANSYYNYSEDSDPLSKVNSLLVTSEIFESTLQKKEVTTYKNDAYSEREAQVRYLESQPVSFIICGKPDIGQKELGRQLANYWNCVYIEPQTLIEEEIASGSRAGECIEFNLRSGRAVGVEIILKLAEKRAKSEKANHRGILLCGLPVMPHNFYREDPLSTESVIFTVKDIGENLFDAAVGEPAPISQPQASRSTNYQMETEERTDVTFAGSHAEIGNKQFKEKEREKDLDQEMDIGIDYEKQLSCLFDLLKKPFFIIYIRCDAEDVLRKRNNYRMNVSSAQIIDMQKRKYNKTFKNYITNDPDNEDESILDSYDGMDTDDFRLKNLVHHPADFIANVSSLLDCYHYTAINFIQNRIIAHNPEYYIKVDGRTSISKMLSIIKSRLQIMKLQPVLIPKKLSTDEIEDIYKIQIKGEGDEDEPVPEIKKGEEELTLENAFHQYRKLQVPSENYMWTRSDWGTKCPVYMKQGIIKEGNMKYCVTFMNKIFFLTDYDACWRFCENPRPFLLPPFPKSNCKIVIFGPPLSGRTALARCLSYYLNGVVLSANEILESHMQKKQENYLKKIKEQATTDALNILNEHKKIEAETKEQERLDNIKEWTEHVVSILKTMLVLQEKSDQEKDQEFQISSFPMKMKSPVKIIDEDSEYALDLIKLRDQVYKLGVPIYNLETSVWKSFINDEKQLLQYLPPDFWQKDVVQPTTVSDEVVKQFVDQAMIKAEEDRLEISEEYIYDIFINYIKRAEDEYESYGLGRGGWIIDGMICNVNVVNEFYPEYIGDEIIVLQDKSEEFLLKRFIERGSTFFSDYRKFFLDMCLNDAALKSPSSTAVEEEGFVKNILDRILDSDIFHEVPREEQYKNELNNFQDEWLKLKNFYLERNIVPIEIDISYKSLPEIFKEVIKTINKKYRTSAHPFTEEDKAEEVANIGRKLLKMDDAGEDVMANETIENIRRYGDTGSYCPVTFTDKWVLWKGREEFGVKFNNAVYLLSTKIDMERFMDDPYEFLPRSYVTRFPPPRICVVGVSGCGKTTIAKKIAEDYGLIYLSYEDFLKEHFKISTNEKLSHLRKYENNELGSYLNDNTSLPERVAVNLLKYWFDEPFKSLGFVWDDFPKNSTDVDIMVRDRLIPDVVIYPFAALGYLKKEFLDRSIRAWMDSIDKQRQDMEIKHAKLLNKWNRDRTIRFDQLMEERRQPRYNAKLQKELDENDNVSAVSSGFEAEWEDLNEVNRILDEEFPPVLMDAPDDNVEAFVSETEPLIVNSIQREVEIIKKIEDKCLSQLIAFKQIKLNFDDFDKTVTASYLTCEPYLFRNKSIFESCYDVSLDVAHRLLTSGYFFLSKFGKTCPIQYYRNKNPIQMHQSSEMNQNLYPVIHRSFIYFINGNEEKQQFKADPLKFISIDYKFPLITFKVGVTGPPKCGKTTLANRMEKEYGFKIISRGEAIRYVLKYLFQSSLAENIETILRKGWELTDEMVIRSVEAVCFDSTVVTQGVIFDGFPNSLNEVKHLSFVDLVPNIVIDLVASTDEVQECLGNYVTELPPKYSKTFLLRLYDQWLKEADDFRMWFDKEYQVSVKLPINVSNWSVWSQSNQFLTSTFWEIKHYHYHIKENWPLRLSNMQVTPLEFLERQSKYKSYCPLCLHFSKSLSFGGNPPDRTNLIQYKQYYYWLCTEHVEMFLRYPDKYLSPYTKYELPANLPKKMVFTQNHENLYADGLCIVCYKTERQFNKGHLNFGVLYIGRAYVFDTANCLNTFLKNPELYSFKMEFRTPVYPELKYKELAILGMLEQYVAKDLLEGLKFIAKNRPIISGLDVSISALIGLGLYIKINNVSLPNRLKIFYEEAFNKFNQRREKLETFLDRLKQYRNPYVYYEEILPSFKLPPPSEKSQSVTTMISRIVDTCVDDMKIYLRDADSPELEYY